MPKPLLLCILLMPLSAVKARKGFGPGEQEWGYVDVRPGAHMFWWLYYTEAEVTAPEERPLLIWLQGGPGASATGIGNFKMFGPLDMHLRPRNLSWVKEANVLFIDSPVGTGFSWVEDKSLLAKSNYEVAQDLVTLTRSFLEEFTRFQNTPLFITSQSYGGKMAVEFASLLNKAIQGGSIKAKFKGLEIGSGWICPMEYLKSYGSYLLNLGFVDCQGHKKINQAVLSMKEAIEAQQWKKVIGLSDNIDNVIWTVTNGINVYNVMKRVPYQEKRVNLLQQMVMAHPLLDDIMNNQVKEALDIPSKIRWYGFNKLVFFALSGDFMKPVVDIVDTLLNTTNLRIAIVSGQQDLIVNTPGTMECIKQLKFRGKEEWNQAKRKPLIINGFVEGYAKFRNRLGMFWINRAGHSIPEDNPAAMQYVLSILTSKFKSE